LFSHWPLGEAVRSRTFEALLRAVVNEMKLASLNDLVVRSTPVDITNHSPLDITFLITRRGPALSVHSFHFPFIRSDSR
jgi:hypothetical protein